MFVGHVGAALAVARLEPRVSAGTFVAASLLLDLVLWVLVLAGVEGVVVPPDFERHRQVAFTFPYSHGLVAAIVWSVLGGAAGAFASRLPAGQRLRGALLLGAVVFSHWLLDALVHRPELPLAGPASLHVGLGLWDRLPIALAVEAGCVAIGALVFSARSGLAGARLMGVWLLCLLLLVFTVAGMSVAPPPPSGPAMAGTSLALLLVVVAAFAWLDRVRARPGEQT